MSDTLEIHTDVVFGTSIKNLSFFLRSYSEPCEWVSFVWFSFLKMYKLGWYYFLKSLYNKWMPSLRFTFEHLCWYLRDCNETFVVYFTINFCHLVTKICAIVSHSCPKTSTLSNLIILSTHFVQLLKIFHLTVFCNI